MARFPWLGARGVRRVPLGILGRHERDLERSSFKPPKIRLPKAGISLKGMMGAAKFPKATV